MGDDGPVKRFIAWATLFVSVACADPGSVERRAPSLPRLDGGYVATIPASAFRGLDVPGSSAGRWKLDIDDGSYVLKGPIFRVTEDLVVTGDDSLTISGLPTPIGAFNCTGEDGNRILPPTEVHAGYSFSIGEGTLELSAEDDPCPYRILLLERTWKPVSDG